MGTLSSPLLSPGALGTALALVIVYVISYFFRNTDTLKHVPLLKDTSHDLREAIAKGYKMKSMFKVSSIHNNIVVLPMKFLNEIKSLPEDKVSFDTEIHHRFLGDYTGMGVSPLLVKVVRVDLTRNVGVGIDVLQDELLYAVDRNIGACEEWTPINLYSSLLRIIGLLSGRVFVGLPLSRNERWLDVTVEYTIRAFISARELIKYPAWARPLLAHLLPETRALNKIRNEASTLIMPILRVRLEEMEQPGYESKKDLIEWGIESSGPNPKNLDEQVKLQLAASLAAIHTTTMTTAHFIYDLVNHPEYFEPLREELKMVLEQDNGIFVKTSMTKLRKLDSFIKESQRLNPPDLLSLQRRVMSDFQLSDGTQLKKNMSIAFPSNEVNRDGSKWANPNEFDGFRFDNLRKEPGSENKYQFVTTSDESINFGHGTHACPGRFFASNEIKLLLAHLILNYDIKFKEGVTERPNNIYHDSTVAPSTEVDLLFRKRKV